jgi:hypothetical protein
MKRLVLALCVFFLTMGLAITARADQVTFSTTGYFQDNIGNQINPPSGWDQLTLDAVGNTDITVTNIPATLNLQGLSFVTGLNSGSDWTTALYSATCDMTVNGITKTIGQSYYVNISSNDTLTFLAAPSTYFDLGGGRSLKVDLLGQTLTALSGTSNGSESNGIVTGNIIADINVVPIPGAIWLFGCGMLGLFGIRRKIS